MSAAANLTTNQDRHYNGERPERYGADDPRRVALDKISGNANDAGCPKATCNNRASYDTAPGWSSMPRLSSMIRKMLPQSLENKAMA